MDNIKFRIVAYTGAAGKYSPDAPMCGNEDNFYVNDNLSDNISGHCMADEIINMSDCGIIMAVCDGMGGMNAGEVASAIAVETIKDYFSPNRVNLDIARNPKARKAYLEKLVVEADKRIKDDSKRNPKHEGMGSTIILAWIVDNELTLTWCGDSRAYRFSPATGLKMLSEDHSYVQELVKKGLITYEDTFDHPQGNIITRSLGDPEKKARPETREFNLYKGDVILLCSDGLSGVLRDRKTKDSDGNYFPGKNIEDLIRDNTSSMVQCKNALWDAAQEADWYDNVTILLCQILEGPQLINLLQDSKEEEMVSDENTHDINRTLDSFNGDRGDKKKVAGWNKTFHLNIKIKPKKILIIGLCAIALCLGLVALFTYRSTGSSSRDIDSRREYLVSVVDSLNKVLANNETFKMMSIGSPDSLICFKEIYAKISNVNDSISLKDAENNLKRFKDGISDRIYELDYITEKSKDCKDEAKLSKLKELRLACLNQSLSREKVENRVSNILNGEAKGTTDVKEEPQITPQSASIETQRKSIESQVPQELTPVKPETIEETFVMVAAPGHTKQINDIVSRRTQEGYAYIGILGKDGSQVSEDKYVAGETYTIRFKKAN